MATDTKGSASWDETVAERERSATPPERMNSGNGGKRSGGRAKRHCARWWWIYLIVFVVVILVVILPVVFVGLPHIAQHDVDASTLSVASMELTDPTPTSFHLRQEQTLHSESKYHPQLDAFNASLFLEVTEPNIVPFAYVTIPAVQSGPNVPIPLDQTVQIANVQQFSRFAALVLTSETYRLAIRGRVGLKEGSLPKTTVNYNEVVTLKGLNRLAGFNVTSFRLLAKPDPDGSNMLGEVYIPNPSVMTIAMGNVTLNLSVQGDPIGTSMIPNLTLKPGNNTLPMRSKVDQTAVFGKLGQFKNGVIPIDVVGNSSVYNGQHLTYYEDALKMNTQHIQLNLADISL